MKRYILMVSVYDQSGDMIRIDYFPVTSNDDPSEIKRDFVYPFDDFSNLEIELLEVKKIDHWTQTK